MNMDILTTLCNYSTHEPHNDKIQIIIVRINENNSMLGIPCM